PAVVSAAVAALAGLAAVCRPLRAAIVLTDDGFEIARIPRGADEHRRLASMASAMQALADAVVRELRIGTNQHLVIDASEGAVVALRVGHLPCALVAVLDDGFVPDDVAEIGATADALARRLHTP
ncbi:roadblock/LC7 domain-containing protein, partial [Schumannella luteola]